ncbi:hypothetical protein TELCIR_16218, partial [Teladorsagia circumcincta]
RLPRVKFHKDSTKEQRVIQDSIPIAVHENEPSPCSKNWFGSLFNKVTFYRFYHVFRKGELESLVHSIPSLSVIHSSFEHDRSSRLLAAEQKHFSNIANKTYPSNTFCFNETDTSRMVWVVARFRKLEKKSCDKSFRRGVIEFDQKHIVQEHHSYGFGTI